MPATLEIEAEQDVILQAWREGWRPPSRAGTIAWATDHLWLEGQYARKGRFSLEGSNYLRLPLELLDDDEVRMINLLKAIQTGGTLIGDVFFHDIFANRLGPTMVTFQSDDDAEKHYLTRYEPTFRATEVNRAKFAQLKRKRDLFRWPHLFAYIQGANVNSLQGKSIKYELNDEVWCWKPKMLAEAWARTEAYRRVCKILNISQACEVGTEWEETWNAGRRYLWGVRCLHPACGKLQPLAFFATMEHDERERAGIVWDREARYSDGRWNESRAAETARFKCKFCGHEHADEERTWHRFDLGGSYICLDPERTKKDCSLRWNGLVSGDWGRLVKKFLRACSVRDNGSTAALEQFYVKDLAEFWDPTMGQQKVELQTSGYMKEAPLAPGYKPEKLEWEELRAITADYQQGTGNDTRHLIVGCRAWSDATQKRSRLLWEGRVNTFEELYRLQLALGVDAQCVCIDGSFEMMEVAAQCAKYGWTMLVGDDPTFFLHKRKNREPLRLPYSERFRVDPEKGKKGQGRRFCWAFRWSNPSVKNMLWNLRHGLTKHTWEVPADVSPSYREGIDSNVKKRIAHKKTGVSQYVWVELIPNTHPWDVECMQVVVAVAAGCLTFDIEEPEKKAGEPQTPPKREAPTPPHDQPEQLELISA